MNDGLEAPAKWRHYVSPHNPCLNPPQISGPDVSDRICRVLEVRDEAHRLLLWVRLSDGLVIRREAIGR